MRTDTPDQIAIKLAIPVEVILRMNALEGSGTCYRQTDRLKSGTPVLVPQYMGCFFHSPFPT